MKIISATNPDDLNPSNDLEIELSLIDSGLIITEVENKVIFIIKESAPMIKGFTNLKSASLNFTTIPRPEFPAILSELKLKTDRDLSVKYDYFFTIESEYELNLLRTIINQNEINLYFLTDIPEKCVKIEIERHEIDQLENCLREI